jgi:hypothetical protein
MDLVMQEPIQLDIVKLIFVERSTIREFKLSRSLPVMTVTLAARSSGMGPTKLQENFPEVRQLRKSVLQYKTEKRGPGPLRLANFQHPRRS